MSGYKIISDSACDLSSNIVSTLDIHIVPFYVSFDAENYLKEGIEISNNEFYKKISVDNLFAKTSLPSVQDYIEVFESYLKSGLDILCICLTSTFSGSYQSAVNAKIILQETYTDRKILVLDSNQACGSQGLLVLEACKMRDANIDILKNFELLELLKKTAGIYFTLDSLVYLQKGGRIGKVSALAGSLLNIKPIIYLKNGELLPFAKVRGRKKALNEIIEIINSDPEKDIYSILIMHSDSLEEANAVRNILINNYNFNIDYLPLDIGVTIGSHVGCTAIGICFIKKFESIM